MESIITSHPMKKKATPFWRIFGYSAGGSAYTLPFNAMWAFALLFYTEVLGLDSVLAGMVLSIPMFWDAIVDPLLGHLSDNTRSRYGKRHPYILAGGIIIAISFFFLWIVPGFCVGKWAIFTYLLIVNLIFRSGIALFMIPYGALGFEVCTDYDERSKLQSTMGVIGMMTNLFGIALGWRIFFPNRGEVDGTKFASNYMHMGLTFSVVVLLMLAFLVCVTRQYIRDSRGDKQIIGNSLWAFYEDIRDVFCDRRAIIIFLFFGISQIGSVLIAGWQSYTWIFYMGFDGSQKTMCHSAGMIGFVLGAILCSVISKKLDKKPVVCMGMGLCIFGSLALLLIFYTGFLGRSVIVPLGGIHIPVSLIVFALFQGLYWMGHGIIGPLTSSMIADISEANKYDTGILKDGSYSAVYCFVVKIVCSAGLFLQGLGLKVMGFQEGGKTQTPEAIDKLALFTFVAGIIFAVAAIAVAVKYPVNRVFMAKIKDALAAREVLESQKSNQA